MSTRHRQKQQQIEASAQPAVDAATLVPQEVCIAAAPPVNEVASCLSSCASAPPELLDDDANVEGDDDDEAQHAPDTLIDDSDVFVMTDDVCTLSLKELRQMCITHNLPPHGKKSELVRRIHDALNK